MTAIFNFAAAEDYGNMYRLMRWFLQLMIWHLYHTATLQVFL